MSKKATQPGRHVTIMSCAKMRIRTKYLDNGPDTYKQIEDSICPRSEIYCDHSHSFPCVLMPLPVFFYIIL